MLFFRKLIILLLIPVLLLALVLPAAAAELAGDPTDEDLLASADDETVRLTSSMYFDLKSGDFIYPIGESGTVVRASVADAMIVTTPVKVKGATLLIYRNGKLWEGDAETISEEGEYVVMAQTGNQTLRMFTFTLVTSATSTVYAYNLPVGMIVSDVTCDGEPARYGRNTVPMDEEGRYHVTYVCDATGRTYTLDLTVDRTPPVIHFDGKIDENNRVHSALAFSGLEKGDTILVTLDGTPIDVTVNPDGTGELTESGSYIITVFDAAGNRAEYGYNIMLYLNSGSLAFFVLLAAAIVALIVYIYLKRKRLEIG